MDNNMQYRKMVVAGGLSLVVGALAFVFVFACLAANFDYPGILKGSDQRPYFALANKASYADRLNPCTL